jgi:internalin A
MSQPTHKPRRRWFQFSLRTLLIIAALAAVGALAWRSYVAPYHQQRKTMTLVEKLGGSYKTAQAGPWLRRLYGQDFQNVTLVNLADCDDPAAYLDQVTALPALETLVVGGPAFTDDHLRRLHKLTTLSGLILDSTNVTDSGLAAMREALPQAEVYQSERRTIVTLRRDFFGVVDTRLNAAHSDLRQLAGNELFEEATGLRPATLDSADLVFLRRLKQLAWVHANGGMHVNDAVVEELKELSQLTYLNVDGTAVSDGGLAHLEGLSQLKVLYLRRTCISDDGLAHLKGLSQLEQLYVSGTQVTDAGLSHLAGLTQLKRLELDGTHVSDAGLLYLRPLGQLDTLFLDDTQVGDAGLAHLNGLSQLQWLDLTGTGVTDPGLAHLKGLSQLKALVLVRTRVSDAGLAHLKGLSQLRWLRLNSTQVSDAGLAHLKALSQLEGLHLLDTQISDAGLAHLKGLTKLSLLEIRKTKVTAAGVLDLHKALPKCEIRTFFP